MHRFGISNLKFWIQVGSPVKGGLRHTHQISVIQFDFAVGIPSPMKRGLRLARHVGRASLGAYVGIPPPMKRGLRHAACDLQRRRSERQSRNSSPDEEGTETMPGRYPPRSLAWSSEFLPR